MALNDTQERFLAKFVNNKGNPYEALSDLGLELSHLLSWRENAEFELRYRDVTNRLILHLRQESFLMASLRVNEALKHGIKQEVFTQEHTISPEQGNTYKVKKTVKNLGVPVAYLKLALSESAIQKAIQILANEGILPTAIAKKIIARAEQISNDLIETFDINEEESEISEQKVIAYIKAAVLKESDE